MQSFEFSKTYPRDADLNLILAFAQTSEHSSHYGRDVRMQISPVPMSPPSPPRSHSDLHMKRHL